MERRLDSGDMKDCQNEPQRTIGVKFGGRLTEEEINDINTHYASKGWRHAVDDECIAFISPCGRWYDCFDRESGRHYHIDQEWISRLNLKPKDKSER